MEENNGKGTQEELNDSFYEDVDFEDGESVEDGEKEKKKDLSPVLTSVEAQLNGLKTSSLAIYDQSPTPSMVVSYSNMNSSSASQSLLEAVEDEAFQTISALKCRAMPAVKPAPGVPTSLVTLRNRPLKKARLSNSDEEVASGSDEDEAMEKRKKKEKMDRDEILLQSSTTQLYRLANEVNDLRAEREQLLERISELEHRLEAKDAECSQLKADKDHSKGDE